METSAQLRLKSKTLPATPTEHQLISFRVFGWREKTTLSHRKLKKIKIMAVRGKGQWEKGNEALERRGLGFRVIGFVQIYTCS